MRRNIGREGRGLDAVAYQRGLMGGDVTTARWHFGQQGMAPMGQRATPQRGLPPGPVNKETQCPV
jgi:hypothetical protein